MPQAIPYIAIAISVASAVYAASIDLSTDPKDTGTIINKSGTRATRDVVYGRCLTGATPLWSNIKNSSRNELVQVFSTGVAVSKIHQLYIDDVAVLAAWGDHQETTSQSSLTFSGVSLANGFEKQCTIQLRTGYPINAPIYNGLPVGTPMNLAISNSDGEWTSAMRGDYTSMVCIKSLRIIDDEAIRIMSESYSLNVEVSGVPVFDPRTNNDPAVKSFSRNPALCALDYITNDYYGMGISFNNVDLESFKTAANHCDVNNFYIDGQLNQGDSFGANLDNICKTAQLHLFIENGKLVCRAETAAMASWSFDEDNILKGSLQVTEQTSQSYSNVISVNYKNSELDDKEDVFTIPSNIYPLQTDPSYPTKPQSDGYIATSELDMPMTRYKGSEANDSNSPMKKFANIELRRQDFQKEIEFEIDKEEYNISVFDVIELSDEAIGWDKKLFRITGFNTKISEEEMNIIKVQCKEYSSTIFDGDMDGTPPSEKPTDPIEVAPPTALQFRLHDIITSGSATLSWTRTWFETNAQFDVEYKKASESTWTRVGRTATNEWKFPNMYPDTYDFRVATWSNLYGSSVFTELLNVVVSQLGVFPPVTGLVCDTTTQDFKFSWDNMLESPVDLPPNPRPDAPSDPKVKDYFNYYRVDIFDNTTLLGTYQATTNSFSYTYSVNRANGLLRTIKANVYIVAKDGTQSQLGTAELTATNPQQSAPTGVVENTELSNTIITWEQPNDYADYRATRFYQSTTSGFIPSTANLLTEQIGTLFSHIWSDEVTHYIKFAHVDVFGNDSESYSQEIAVTPKTIDVSLPIDPDFGKIRDPQGAQGKEQVFKSADGEYVAGIGIYADETTEETKVLMAADKVLMGVGGRPFYDNAKAYIINDKVLYKRTADITALYQCKLASTGNLPTDTTYWTELQSNADQAVFAVDESGKVLIENAVIEELTSDNIKVRSIVANSIEAKAITGEEINSLTTIIAGDDTTVQPLPNDAGFEVGTATIGAVLEFNGYNTDPNEFRSGFENIFDYDHGDWYGGITGFAVSADGDVGYYTIAQVRSGMPPEFRIYKSTNGCATWTNLGNKGWYGASKVVCSSDGQIVYVSDIDDGYIWRSVNGASSFTRVANIGSAGYISMACSGDGQTVYYSSESRELWKSTNQATSFSKIHDSALGSRSIAINDDGRIVYAQTSYLDATQTIISKSEDFGVTFNQVYSEPVSNIDSNHWDLACSLDGGKLYGTRSRDKYTLESRDGGISFAVIGIPEWSSSIRQIELAYAHYEDRMYFATSDGGGLPAQRLAIFRTGSNIPPLGDISPPELYHTILTRFDEIYDNNYLSLEQPCQIEFGEVTDYIPNPLTATINGINHTFNQVGDTTIWETTATTAILSADAGTTVPIILSAAATPDPIALAGMNGYDDDLLPNGDQNPYKDVRFWSGAATPYGAKFIVDKLGSLKATNAYVRGHIDATSGTFSGSLLSPDIEGGTIRGGFIEGGTIIGANIITTDTYITVRPSAFYPDGEKILTKNLPYSSSQQSNTISRGVTTEIQSKIRPYNATSGYAGDAYAEDMLTRYVSRELVGVSPIDGSVFGFYMSGVWVNPEYYNNIYNTESWAQCYLRIYIDVGSGWGSGTVHIGSIWQHGTGLNVGARAGVHNITVSGVPLKVTVSAATYKVEINGVYNYSGNTLLKVKAGFEGQGYDNWGSLYALCNIKLHEHANNAIGGDRGATSNTSNITSLQYIEPTEPMAMSRMVEPKTEVMLSSQDTQQTETFKATQLQVMERFDPKGNSTGLYLKGRKLNESVLFE